MPNRVEGISSLTTNEICWVAGWLEGEGSFTIYQKDRYKQFRIEFSSSDLDIIKRIRRLMRSNATIFLRKQGYCEDGTKKKPEYYLKITDNLAIQWMMTLYCLMGERRKEKIKSILNQWKDYIQNGSNICRTCKSKLTVSYIKSGWNKGKKNTFCYLCRSKNVRLRKEKNAQ